MLEILEITVTAVLVRLDKEHFWVTIIVNLLVRKTSYTLKKKKKIEIIFPSYLENKILNTLYSVHPYEEVAYEIYLLDNVNQDIGSGLYGKLKKPMKSNDFLRYLKKIMQTKCIRYTNLNKEYIETVSVCGGSGSFLLDDAKKSKSRYFHNSRL